MPHYPKPFFRTARSAWYIQIEGRQYRLGAAPAMSREAAEVAAVRLKERLRREGTASTAAVPRGSFAALADDYLSWCQRNRAQRTYDLHRQFLQRFLEYAGPRGEYRIAEMPEDAIRPFHIQEWAMAQKAWSAGGRRCAMVVLQRVYNWAYRCGRVSFPSPLVGLEKPPMGRRQTILSEKEFQDLLQLLPSSQARDLVEFIWSTGARPQEVRLLEARHLDLANSRAVFPPEEAKGKRQHRIIYLVGRSREIIQRLAQDHPVGALFRNTQECPWNARAVHMMLRRVRDRLGLRYMKEHGIDVDPEAVRQLSEQLRQRKTRRRNLAEARQRLRAKEAGKHAPQLSLYILRHSWATRALQNGVDPITIATLMGHADTSMLARVYQHLALNPAYLLDAATRASGSANGAGPVAESPPADPPPAP